jgi:hypothetical protein
LSYPSIRLTRQQAVDRALSQVGKGTYKLSTGGRNPSNPDPFTRVDPDDDLYKRTVKMGRDPRFSDCSGFTGWCIGIDRFQESGTPGEWWVNSDSSIRDATRKTGNRMFRLVPNLTPVLPGDLIAYGRAPDLGKNYGHIGLITKVHEDFRRGARGWYKCLEVTHCTPAKPVRPYAVKTDNAELWRTRGYIFRFLNYVGEGS